MVGVNDGYGVDSFVGWAIGDIVIASGVGDDVVVVCGEEVGYSIKI